MDNKQACGTVFDGIGATLEKALSERVPKYGGRIVDCAVTVSGAVLRASDGWIIELCDDAIHLRRVGESVYTSGCLSLFRHAGDEPPHTIDEIADVHETDRQNYRAAMANLLRHHREAKRVDEEFDRVFANLQAGVL